MISKIKQNRRKLGNFVLYVPASIIALTLYFSQPEIDDFIEVRSIEVVSLVPGTINRRGAHCITSAVEKSEIEVGDMLFVKPDIIFLTDYPGRYRTAMRDFSMQLNVYDERQWSAEIPYTAGSRYCAYAPMWWWIGKDAQPDLDEGTYNLTTEYKFDVNGGGIVEGAFPSKSFVVRRSE